MDGWEREGNAQDRSSGETINRPALSDKQSLDTTPLSPGASASPYKSLPPPDSLSHDGQYYNQVNPIEDNMQTPRSSFPPTGSLAKRPDSSTLRQDGISPTVSKSSRQEHSITDSGGYFDPMTVRQHSKKASLVTSPSNLETLKTENLATTNAVPQGSPGQPLTTW